MTSSSSRRRFVWLAVRIGVTVLAFAFLFSRVELAQVGSALSSLPPSAALLALALAFFGLWIGNVRWRVLIRSAGATRVPSLSRLYRLVLIGIFYNTVLPGAVGGDIVRGLATSESFGERGATSAIAVTFLERLAGLGGLVLVCGVAFMLRPLPGVEGLMQWGGVGMAVVAVGTLLVGYASRIARHAPAVLEPWIAKLPDVQRPSGLAIALLLSVGTHLCVVGMGHVLLASLHPSVTLLDSSIVMPLVALASYFPLTIAGAGAREAAFVALARLLGVPEATALAAALSLFGCQLVVAAVGGVLHLLKPLRDTETPA